MYVFIYLCSQKTPLKNKHRFVNMLVFAGMFMIVPFLFTSFVETFAPVEYFVDVDERLVKGRQLIQVLATHGDIRREPKQDVHDVRQNLQSQGDQATI